MGCLEEMGELDRSVREMEERLSRVKARLGDFGLLTVGPGASERMAAFPVLPTESTRKRAKRRRIRRHTERETSSSPCPLNNLSGE